MDTLAHVLVYLGLLGLAEFAALTFATQQLTAFSTGRLRRKLDNPVVRNARALTAVFAVVLVAGLVLLQR